MPYPEVDSNYSFQPFCYETSIKNEKYFTKHAMETFQAFKIGKRFFRLDADGQLFLHTSPVGSQDAVVLDNMLNTFIFPIHYLGRINPCKVFGGSIFLTLSTCFKDGFMAPVDYGTDPVCDNLTVFSEMVRKDNRSFEFPENLIVFKS